MHEFQDRSWDVSMAMPNMDETPGRYACNNEFFTNVSIGYLSVSHYDFRNYPKTERMDVYDIVIGRHCGMSYDVGLRFLLLKGTL